MRLLSFLASMQQYRLPIVVSVVSQAVGVHVTLVGILRVEHLVTEGSSTHLRVIVLAEANVDGWQAKDAMSSAETRVRWCNLEEIENMNGRSERLRGDEVVFWARYVQEGETALVGLSIS